MTRAQVSENGKLSESSLFAICSSFGEIGTEGLKRGCMTSFLQVSSVCLGYRVG